MTGFVKGELRAWGDGTISVLPDDCPVDRLPGNEHPACYTTYPDGEFRACIMWQACTAPANSCDRRHPTQLRQDAVKLGARTLRCGVICHGQKRNRAPGC